MQQGRSIVVVNSRLTTCVVLNNGKVSHWEDIACPHAIFWLEMDLPTNFSKPLCYEEKLPMDCGVPQQTTLTLEINLSQYARENKHLTLRDTESYLVPDGWSRTPLSFPIHTCINNSLSTTKRKTSMLYNNVLDLLYHIYSSMYNKLNMSMDTILIFKCTLIG